jgi:hypothetical protein
MYSTRGGFMRCSKPNSPLVFHHSDDNREKWEISSALIVVKLGPGAALP